jgi:hypothetical protein
MTVTNQGGSLLDSVIGAQTTRQDIGVAVLKKTQDAVKQEGAAMLRLIEQAGPQEMPSGGGPLLDAYA